eukprot:g62781.t1
MDTNLPGPDWLLCLTYDHLMSAHINALEMYASSAAVRWEASHPAQCFLLTLLTNSEQGRAALLNRSLDPDTLAMVPQLVFRQLRMDEKSEHPEEALGPIICTGHSRPVPDLQYSQVTVDGYFLISSCLDGKPMIRQGISGDWIGTFEGHKGAVWATRLNSSAELALTGSGDFSACLWDAVDGEVKSMLPHNHIVKAVAFSKDSERFMTGGMEKKVRIFDTQNPTKDPTVWQAEQKIEYLETTAEHNLVFSCSSAEAFISVWDQRTGKVAQRLKTANKITSMQVSMEGGFLSVSSGKQVLFYDTKNLHEVANFVLPRVIDCVAFHPRARCFVTGSNSELNARVYSFDNGREIGINKGHHGPVRCVAFSPAGDSYATGSEDGTIRLWACLPPPPPRSQITDSQAPPQLSNVSTVYLTRTFSPCPRRPAHAHSLFSFSFLFVFSVRPYTATENSL